MAERAVLFTLDADGEHAAWRSAGRTAHGTLAELAACGAEAFVWLIDGRRVQLAEIDLPPGNRREQAQALPYALEDQILTPLDGLGFAIQRQTTTRHAAAVFDIADLESRLARLEAAGIRVDQCVPDILCVPWQESGWTLLFSGDDAWLRTGPYAGQRFASAQWEAFVEQALVGVDGERHVRVFGADDARLARIAALSPALVVDSAARATAPDLPALFADGHAQGQPLDLLTALPRRREAGDGAARRWWRASAALLMVGALAHAGFMAWHVARLDTQAVSERARTEAVFRDMFPGITRIEDVRVQASQALADAALAAEEGTPFLDLLAATGQVLAQQAGAGLEFESVSYGNGALELRVRADSMAALETYQQALGATALPVQLLSVENRDDDAIGLLRVGQPR